MRSITAIFKHFKNDFNDCNETCELFDKDGNLIGKFSGGIYDVGGYLYVLQNGYLYDIVLHENGEYTLVKHEGSFPLYSLNHHNE